MATARDRGVKAAAVSHGAVAGHGEERGGIRLPVTDEYVRSVVVVGRGEVRGLTVKGHVAAIGRDRGFEAVEVPFGAVAGHRDELGGPFFLS